VGRLRAGGSSDGGSPGAGCAEVGAPAGKLFDFLGEDSNLPRYFTAMTGAEPAGQDEVYVVADADGVTLAFELGNPEALVRSRPDG